MRRFLFSSLAALILTGAAAAQDAHPALWTVHGPHGTVTLVASLHLLPPGTNWHTPAIDSAMQSADSFVFEVPTGMSERDEETRFIVDNGLLPRGKTLSTLLDDEASKHNYRRALTMAGMDADNIDQKQPWLAEVVLTVQAMYRRNYSANHTPEGEAHDFAVTHAKDVRYLDTTRQQLEFLAGADSTRGVTQLKTVLADFPNQAAREQRFVDAWAGGDLDTSAALIAAGLHDLPDEARRLQERNRDWTRQIEAMLSEDRSFFLAVGIAHLAGSRGVPALLRADGYKVDGP
jgi:uncharacterized protein YbaP (TraB family)